jgi:thiamine-phosphate pyrophosphorylase
MNEVDLRVYGIVGPEHGRSRDLAEAVRAAAAGGATLVQYRDKASGGRAMVETVRALKRALDGTGVPLLVNDRVDIALAAGADGVHLGQDDMAVEDARALLGRSAIIGLTVKTPAQAGSLTGASIDYACIGGVFATTSKGNPEPPVGLSGLSAIAAQARRAAPGLPIGAIAGIDAGNAASVIGAGADGVAVISAIFGSSDPRIAARALRSAVDSVLAGRGVLK